MIRPRPAASLAAQFAKVARAQQNAVAVIHGHEQLSYAELDQHSSALAAKLAAATEPNAPVGICLPAGLDAVVAIVAAIRAGRPYVPLDPNYPEQRLRYICDDARLAAVMVGDGTPDAVRQHAAPIEVDGHPGQHPEPPEPSLATPAYIIYTSGSTGRPKGVVVSHGNVAALLDASTHLFQFSSTDTWTLFHSISFDFSVWELWGALLHGARLVIVDQETRLAPGHLLDLLERERVTVFNVVPSIFRDIAAEFVSRPRDLTLRLIIFGGEPVHLPSAAGFRAACSQPPAMVNMYGITETTVHVTAHVIRADDYTAGVSPIGTPLPHLDVAVFDEQLKPVPVGTIGELCVAGAGVAAGYLHRPELTAERFVWLGNPGRQRRFYRSGDLARWSAQGTLEYVGRADHQVKIRGFRIELEEIEAGLESLPQVSAAAVTVEHNRSGEPILVGYIMLHHGVQQGDDPKLARTLRSALRRSLPAHLIPGRLVPTAALPRTPSGKLDRAQLGTNQANTTKPVSQRVLEINDTALSKDPDHA